jgi:hypothetical protein
MSAWGQTRQVIERAQRIRKSPNDLPNEGGSHHSLQCQFAVVLSAAILNHVSGSRSPLQRVYDRYDRLREMREVLQLYERHLAGIVAEG